MGFHGGTYLPNPGKDVLKKKSPRNEHEYFQIAALIYMEVTRLPLLKHSDFWTAVLELGDLSFFGEYRFKNSTDEKNISELKSRA